MAQNICRLRITNAPQECFRFRTVTDAKHGKLKGIDGKGITVKLENFAGNLNEVIVLCTIYQFEEPFHMYLHPNLLMKFDSNGIAIFDPINSELNNDGTATFSDMGIVKPHKKKIEEALSDKISRIQTYKPDYTNNTNTDKVDMNNIRLCFEAFKRENNQFSPICDPVFSKYITNSDKSGIIWCCANCTGEASGNDKFIIACDYQKNIKKENIKIRFYELFEGNEIIWEKYAEKESVKFCPHSFIITTPAYKNIDISRDVKVYFEVLAGEIKSKHKEFTYKASMLQKSGEKRKKTVASNFTIDTIILDVPEEMKETFRTAENLINYFQGSNHVFAMEQNVIRHNMYMEQDSIHHSYLFDMEQDGIDQSYSSRQPATSTPSSPSNSEMDLLKELKEENILHKLIEENEKSKINELLNVIEKHNPKYNLGKQILQLQNDNGDTSLHIACNFNRVEYIATILLLGADPNIRNNNGDTALHIAVEKNHENCISLIIDDNSLNINLTNDKGNSALYLAILLKNYNIAKKLIIDGNAAIEFQNETNGNNLLHLVVMQFNLLNGQEIKDMIRFLLQNTSTDLNVENHCGLTPLAIIQEFVNDDAQDIIDLLTNLNAEEELENF